MEPADGERRAEHAVYVRFAPCGSRITLRPDPGLPLELVSATPLRLREADHPGYAYADLSVRNRSRAPVSVLTSRSGARMVICKDGVVVARSGGSRPVGSVYTIAAGEARDHRATVGLIGCNPEERLKPGDYQLHALQRFMFVDRDGVPGESMLVYGGPWDIELG